jgi:hypothetical protein
MEINILRNGGKGVVNCIMGSSAFVVISTTVYTHIKGCLQLWDGVVQVMYEVLWKKLRNIIKRLGRLIEL